MKIFTALIAIILILFLIISLTKVSSNPTYGVSFSPTYAKFLGLDWKGTYLDILNNLKVKKLRIGSYWSQFQPIESPPDFTDLDFMVNEASRSGAKIVLVVGIKQPRWPECHIPDWASKLNVKDRQNQALNYLEIVVKRYTQNSTIEAWQVENEPLFSFGENCDPADINFLKNEIALVKKLDPNRQIIVTDTGEWSSWIEAMKLSDILGISVYRKTHNQIIGYAQVPFPALYYNLKSKVARVLFAPKNLKTEVLELQAEPWILNSVIDTKITDQVKLFSIDDLKSNVNFASEIDSDKVYLWGVEWYYYMAQKDHPEYLQYAKGLFN